ncbi:hypothetical protein EHQ27_05520 [Leptospira wolffii]|uniref:toxin-antitoxin system YwqK family antitoxin n=1 Tax=Leptospira wolffii TaxID=409998 RepID=UPI0010824D3F|nr:hypothetical protein [Leptospira wolffii]TGK62750.1 hypothetical protein EHQ32_08080 [Leptospira wolffii]TGK73863.1 hypothetical protein EHQ35_05685 [Leptospira wolffii]TGK75018.1 hypothetical protein EHQ27_05520 [Leptospira wolffii]TGL28725.1 hypothetical protein EHQ57_12210 [Leptospira wolffii]
MICAFLLGGGVAFLLHCDPTLVRLDDPGLSRQGEFVFYQGQKFDGILEFRIEELATMRRTSYKNGLPHGTETDRHDNGQILAEREFKEGKKSGIHRGWFPDGSKRFQNRFLDGKFHGDQWEWRPSGALYSYARFDRGEVIGKKMWRENGQIYMNFVLNGNRPFGMTGGKLCNQIRGDENGNTQQF